MEHYMYLSNNAKIPSAFDAKLRNKIALRNSKRGNNFFSYSNSQRWLIYGFSSCIVLCIIILSITLINKQGSLNDNSTFIYEGNKVTIIPPTTNDATSSVGNTGIGTIKNDSISPEKKEEYFTPFPIDSNTIRILDSLNKIDSIKRKLDSQKVIKNWN